MQPLSETGSAQHGDGQASGRAGPTVAARAAVSATIAILCALLVVYDRHAAPGVIPDVNQIWIASRSLLAGHDPYALIGPGREFDLPFPLYYPLTAAVLVAPLAVLPLEAAQALFVAIPAGLLAYHLTRFGYGRLALFASGSFLACVKMLQWTPWLACALLMPWLGFLVAAKPNLGLVMVAGFRSRRQVLLTTIGAALTAAVAFALQPRWVTDWRDAVAGAEHFRSFVSLPGGALLGLALLRWRLWEARVLLVLSVVPQTVALPATLPLMLFPRTRRGLLLVAILSYAPMFFAVVPPGGAFADYTWGVGRMTLWAVMLPAVAVLLRRPNVGPVPPWLARRVAGWPRWLRGDDGPASDPREIAA